MHPVSWLQRVEGQFGGCGQHLVTIFHDSFHGFSYLEGMLELFHFKRVKVSLLSVLCLPYMSSNELNFNLSPGADCMPSKAIGNNFIQFS